MASVHLRAASIGEIARELMTDGGGFDVTAVFERSAYLQLPGGFVCIGAPEIGRGPINILLDMPARATMTALGFVCGAEGACAGSRLSIDEGPVVDVGSAEVWTLTGLPAWSPAGLERGARILQQCGDATTFDDGLACLAFSAGCAGLQDADSAGCGRTRCGAAPRTTRCDARAIGRSDRTAGGSAVGLGTRLDAVRRRSPRRRHAGAVGLGHVALRDALWEVLLPELGELTNEISAMHLALAADGQASQAMHAALDAVLTGDETSAERHIARAAATGHTSGWDTLAGIAITIEAWRAAKAAG